MYLPNEDYYQISVRTILKAMSVSVNGVNIWNSLILT